MIVTPNGFDDHGRLRIRSFDSGSQQSFFPYLSISA